MALWTEVSEGKYCYRWNSRIDKIRAVSRANVKNLRHLTNCSSF